MRKNRCFAFLLSLVMLLAVSGTAALAAETVKIGGIGVLSGPYAQYGLAVKNGVDLYVEQLNAAGGIDGKQVEMIWEDTQADQTVGINAYNKLVDNDGVVAIIGPVLTGVTKAVAQFAADIGIPMITASATAYEITTGRPNVFRTCFLDPFQSQIIARYAKEEGLKKFGVIYDNGDEYSKGLYEAFEAECQLLGIELIKPESAAMSDVDFKAQLTNIKNGEPDAIFLPYYGATAALILAQANELGMQTKFFGADGIADIVASIGDKKLLTSMVYSDHFTTDADSEKAAAFVAEYQKKYGELPSISFSATGYDAAMVLCEAIKAAGTTEYAAVVAALKATSVEAVSGKITFDDHNDPIKSAFFMTFDAEGNKVFIRQQDP